MRGKRYGWTKTSQQSDEQVVAADRLQLRSFLTPLRAGVNSGVRPLARSFHGNDNKIMKTITRKLSFVAGFAVACLLGSSQTPVHSCQKNKNQKSHPHSSRKTQKGKRKKEKGKRKKQQSYSAAGIFKINFYWRLSWQTLRPEAHHRNLCRRYCEHIQFGWVL